MAAQQEIFATEFESTTEAAISTLNDALAALVKTGWIEAGAEFSLRLCLEEALVNAVHHGNCGDPERLVQIQLIDEGEVCRIRVKDEGCGFDPHSMDVPEHTSPGGRGVCIMKHYMEDVTFDSTECCLEMTFKRKTRKTEDCPNGVK